MTEAEAHDLLIRIDENVKHLQVDVNEHATLDATHWLEVTQRLRDLEHWRWKIIGAAVAVSVVLSMLGSFLSAWLTKGVLG